MQSIANAKITTFETWERDSSDRSHLTVIHSGDGVQVAFVDSLGESALLEMSAVYASEIGDNILASLDKRVYADQQGVSSCNAEGSPDPQLKVIVRDTNRGEPYETGLLFHVCCQNNFTDVIHAEFDRYEGRNLAKALKR